MFNTIYMIIVLSQLYVDHMVYDKLLRVSTSHVILRGMLSDSGQLIELMVVLQ